MDETEQITDIPDDEALDEQTLALLGMDDELRARNNEAQFNALAQMLNESIAMGMQHLANQIEESTKRIVSAIQAPKRVSVGGIQRDADGRPIGATVNATPTTIQ